MGLVFPPNAVAEPITLGRRNVVNGSADGGDGGGGSVVDPTNDSPYCDRPVQAGGKRAENVFAGRKARGAKKALAYERFGWRSVGAPRNRLCRAHHITGVLRAMLRRREHGHVTA